MAHRSSVRSLYRILASFFVVAQVLSAQPGLAQKGKTSKTKAPEGLNATATVTPPKKHKMTDTVGIVNGTPILLYSYKDVLGDIIRSAARDSMVSEERFTVYVNAAWNQIVGDILSEQEIAKRHLAASDSETLTHLLDNPPDFLVRQFTNNQGVLQREAMRTALESPSNDSVTKVILGVERIKLEHEKLLRSVAPTATTDAERERQYTAWLRAEQKKSRIEDRRTAFGFY